ncbi:MAG TPA: hypothetical protein VFK52_09220 [Nocardioidaceae bacterium]|nr:hypothetical protein [Nocardioidaceae bacterium]
MPTIRPGSIYSGYSPPGADELIPAVPVGASDQWADDSDSTYCDIEHGYTGITGFSSTLAAADFDPVPGIITGVTVHIRFELLASGLDPSDQTDAAFFRTSVGDTSDPYAFVVQDDAGESRFHTFSPTVGEINWLSFTMPNSGVTLERVQAVFNQGATIQFHSRVTTPAIGNPVFRIYEVIVDVSLANRKPIQRLYPRGRGGTATAARVWPPDRSQLSSNRVAGGTFL